MALQTLAQLSDTSELFTQRQATELTSLQGRVDILEAERQNRADNARIEAEAIVGAQNRSAAATEARAAAELRTWMERRGAPGGRARAHTAARDSDGIFASAIEVAKAEHEARLTLVHAGEARAAPAGRDEEGRFLPAERSGN